VFVCECVCVLARALMSSKLQSVLNSDITRFKAWPGISD